MTMKRLTKLAVVCAVSLLFSLPSAQLAAQTGKTLTNDPLTGLPIPPSNDPMHLGNAPTDVPEYQVCKSKAQTNMYSLNGIKMNATAAWFGAKLPGFKKSEVWTNGKTAISFNKPDGTVMVSLTGRNAPKGQDADVFGITYVKFTPALSEKSIAGFAVQNIVCN